MSEGFVSVPNVNISRVRALLIALAGAALLAGCATSDAQLSPQSSAQDAATSASASPSPTYPVSSDWVIDPSAEATDQQVAAFTGASSVAPGDELDVYISAAGSAEVSVYRLGPYEGKGAVQVLAPTPVNTALQTAVASDPTTKATSAPWDVSTTLQTDQWPPGLYFLHVSSGGVARNVPFVVRDTDLAGKVVFVAGDTTWQAYNSWGGKSLYKGANGFADRSYAVSFDRPYSSADWQIWYDFDVSVISALQETSAPIGYTSVTAITADPDSLDGAAGVISNGHDEYWPLPYRDALVQARDAGTNLAFLGANAGYWRVRLEDTATGPDRLMVGYKSAALDPVSGARDTTARYRDNPQPLPETTVVGQLYDCYPSAGDVTITQPDFFLFAGTGVQKGTDIPGLVGNESDRAYATADTPRPIQVPAVSTATCKDTTTYSTMVYYTVPSGAGVFSTGTMNWGRAMSGPTESFGLTQATTDFTRTVTRTLAENMAAGPMGKAHPAQDDYSVIAALPNVNNAG